MVWVIFLLGCKPVVEDSVVDWEEYPCYTDGFIGWSPAAPDINHPATTQALVIANLAWTQPASITYVADIQRYEISPEGEIEDCRFWIWD